MSESMVQMQRKLADVTAKLEKVEAELARLQHQTAVAEVRIDGQNLKFTWLSPTIGTGTYSLFLAPCYAAPVPEQREGNLAVAAPTTSDDQFREAMKKLHAVLLQSAPQSGSEPQKEYAWECNECGAQEYTMSVGQSIIESGALACGSCGCDEFHKAEVRND